MWDRHGIAGYGPAFGIISVYTIISRACCRLFGTASTGKARGQIRFPATVAASLGLPVNAEFNRPMHFKDANGDGIITPDEVTVDTGYVYIGYSNPRDIVSITNGVDLLNRKLRLTARLVRLMVTRDARKLRKSGR